MLNKIYSPSQIKKIQSSKLLLVGCGGVGCEVIKNIIKLGIKDIVLIDDDYVELSNLNRQFYFSKQTINKSKSFSIQEMVQRDYPTINVEAYYCKIQNSRFNSDFYKSISVVLSALDNKEAKEHLCFMCIKYNLPLIIVGAEGYKGQIKVVLRGKYECLFCDQNLKVMPNDIAVCNVRGVPETSKHCVIWAQYFLENLLNGSERTYLIKREILSHEKEIHEHWQNVFNEIFSDNVEKNPDFKNLNKLIYQELLSKHIPLLNEIGFISKTTVEFEEIMDLSYYAKVFVDNLEFLYNLSKDHSSMESFNDEYNKKLSFYSNNQNIINFLTAATNLKVYVYKNVKPKLVYLPNNEVKTIVGEIVPSIASTNSIVGAIQINELLKLLLSDKNDFKSQIKWVSNDIYQKIKPRNTPFNYHECKICSWKILYFIVSADFDDHSLSQLLIILQNCQTFQPEKISYEDHQLIIYDFIDTKNMNIYEENLKKPIRNLLIDKTQQEINIKISIRNKKLDFEWNLVLKHKKELKLILIEDPEISNKIKSQLFIYYKNKEAKRQADVFKFYKNNIEFI